MFLEALNDLRLLFYSFCWNPTCFFGLNPNVSRKLANCSGWARGAKKITPPKKCHILPLHNKSLCKHKILCSWDRGSIYIRVYAERLRELSDTWYLISMLNGIFTLQGRIDIEDLC